MVKLCSDGSCLLSCTIFFVSALSSLSPLTPARGKAADVITAVAGAERAGAERAAGTHLLTGKMGWDQGQEAPCRGSDK